MASKREQICRVLCGKEKCNPDLCACAGKQNKRCRQLGKSFIHNMNEGQINYVTSKLQKNVFLKACPGSGKRKFWQLKYHMKKSNGN